MYAGQYDMSLATRVPCCMRCMNMDVHPEGVCVCVFVYVRVYMGTKEKKKRTHKNRPKKPPKICSASKMHGNTSWDRV